MESTVQAGQNNQIKPKSHSTPKDFFLNLGAIVALYVLAGGFLSFVFAVINQLFPETALYDTYASDSFSSAIKTGLSCIIVAYPVLLYLSRLIFKDLTQNPEKREYAIRRWLVYLTLFITGVAIAIDVIVLLNYLLDGEITTRFVLKVVAVLLTAGLIFWYYISDIKGTFYSEPKKRKIFFGVVTAIIVASIVTGFALVGSPSTQREYRLDEQRVSDLTTIKWEIVNVYQQSGKLPATLADLNDSIRDYTIQTDPVTKLPYEYSVVQNVSTATSGPSFQLCATFARETRQQAKNQLSSDVRELTSPDNWKHGAGRVCFTKTIDPVRYPVTVQPGIKN
ncbi:MAG: hypothetical protein RL094_541 [Candidatus Parcubacteria bacterium]|jgi:hypothetical protein